MKLSKRYPMIQPQAKTGKWLATFKIVEIDEAGEAVELYNVISGKLDHPGEFSEDSVKIQSSKRGWSLLFTFKEIETPEDAVELRGQFPKLVAKAAGYKDLDEYR